MALFPKTYISIFMLLYFRIWMMFVYTGLFWSCIKIFYKIWDTKSENPCMEAWRKERHYHFEIWSVHNRFAAVHVSRGIIPIDLQLAHCLDNFRNNHVSMSFLLFQPLLCISSSPDSRSETNGSLSCNEKLSSYVYRFNLIYIVYEDTTKTSYDLVYSDKKDRINGYLNNRYM